MSAKQSHLVGIGCRKSKCVPSIRCCLHNMRDCQDFVLAGLEVCDQSAIAILVRGNANGLSSDDGCRKGRSISHGSSTGVWYSDPGPAL